MSLLRKGVTIGLMLLGFVTTRLNPPPLTGMVASQSQTSAVSTVRPVVAPRPAAPRSVSSIPQVLSAATSSSSSASSLAASAPRIEQESTPVTLTSASLTRRLFALLGKPKDGQILSAKDGKPVWIDAVLGTKPAAPLPTRTSTSGGGRRYEPEGRPIRSGGGGSTNQPAPVIAPSGVLEIGNTTGTLGQNRGGTSFTSYASGDLLLGNSAGGLSKLSIGNSNEVLSVSGSTARWTSLGTLTLTANDSRYVNTSGDTMTGTLTIGLSSGTVGLKVLQTISGSTIRADRALASSGTLSVEGNARFDSTLTLNGVTYSFPGADGSASGKVLATNGAGQLSWTDGSQWTNGSGLIYYTSGNVGIGTTSPKAKLDVVGTISGSALTVNGSATFNGLITGTNSVTLEPAVGGNNSVYIKDDLGTTLFTAGRNAGLLFSQSIGFSSDNSYGVRSPRCSDYAAFSTLGNTEVA